MACDSHYTAVMVKAHKIRGTGALVLFKKNFAVLQVEGWDVGITDHIHLIPP